MRVPKVTNSVAIYGLSCTGKTSLAARLASLTGLRVRHCGKLVVERAQGFGLASGDELSAEQHEAIDTETQQLVSKDPPMIVEGRFLDQVLCGIGRVLFVRLTCDLAIREKRLEALHGRAFGDSIKRRDDADANFRSTQYHASKDKVLEPMIVVDTSAQSVEACAEAIVQHLVTLS